MVPFKSTIPNYLSIFRLLAGPAIMYLFLSEERTVSFEATWVALYVFACLTDLFDGMIAEEWPSQRSRFGKLIDPLADKALVISIIILIYLVDKAGWLELIFMGVIILREVFVIFARKPFIGKTDILSVVEIGRWKAGFQMVALGVILGREGVIGWEFRQTDSALSIQSAWKLPARYRDSAYACVWVRVSERVVISKYV